MIIRARVVVTMDGPPIEDGAAVVSEDRIIAVGMFSEISAQHSIENVVDLGEQVLLPGLINTHCHLDYTCLRGKIPRPQSFTDWIRAINAEKAKLSPDDYVRSINEGFTEAKRFGTTTIANLTAFPESISKVDARIRTWWFPELIDIRQQISDEDLNALCIQVSEAAKHWGLAPHAPFTASADLYRRCEEIAWRENILLTTHLAESREEMSMLLDASGPLFEFLKEIGRDMSDCGAGTPIGRFSQIARDVSTSRLRSASARQALGMTDDWILVHLNEISDKDFEFLADSKDKGSVVHCPRSHGYFGHSPFQFEKLRKLGFNICLGTDSLATNDDLSLFAEMRAFQKEGPKVSPEEILKMVTVNSARALGQQDALGKIRPDFLADMIALPIARAAFAKASSAKSTSVFDAIMAFDQPVSWSMIGGEIHASPSP